MDWRLADKPALDTGASAAIALALGRAGQGRAGARPALTARRKAALEAGAKDAAAAYSTLKFWQKSEHLSDSDRL